MLGLLFLCVKGVAAVLFTRAHEFSPRFAAFCRIVSRPADGDLGDRRLSIDDWGLMIGDCKVSPWAVVSLEWPWVYGSTWVLFCQIRRRGMFGSDGEGDSRLDSRLRGNDVGGGGNGVGGYRMWCGRVSVGMTGTGGI